MSRSGPASRFRAEGRCAVYEEPAGPAGVRVRERPVSGSEPGEVVVRIDRAALNHLDLWTAKGVQRVEPPQVICGDGAGVVESTGDSRFSPGDEVVIYPVVCCWECEACRAGQQVFCPSFGVVGEHSDGAACEYFHVPGRNVYRRPANLSADEAAAFPLTWLTAWRMLTTRAKVRPGETVLVVGAGAGLASAAVAIAKHLGARVFVTSRSDEKRSRALGRGAEQGFDSASFANEVREATGGRGVDVVFEHVGPATLDQSIRSLALGGRLVFAGSTSGPKAEINMPRLFFRHADLMGSTMGNASEFEEVLKAIEAADLHPEVDSTYPLESVQEALERLDSGEQQGKIVLRVRD